MAGAREIRTKIKSVANTRKVTRALEMVSASKIRKAQELMRASRPYARAMRQVIGHIAHATAEYKHPFMVKRESVKRIGYIVVSTDRGLCGGLNANLFRKLLGEIREWQAKGVEIDVVTIGSGSAIVVVPDGLELDDPDPPPEGDPEGSRGGVGGGGPGGTAAAATGASPARIASTIPMMSSNTGSSPQRQHTSSPGKNEGTGAPPPALYAQILPPRSLWVGRT